VALQANVPFLYHRNGKKSVLSQFPFLALSVYREQVLQLLEEQVLHALVPPEADKPLELLQNREIALSAEPLHLGHKPASEASLIGLISSNLSLQFEQKYSYIGIVPSFKEHP